MKRIHLFFIAALCAVSMSAQMRIWNNGQKLFEINLSMIDSVTFVKSGEPVNPDTGSVTPPQTDTTMFDYDHWREQTKIRIYGERGWEWKYLPWNADISEVTMPESYRYPNKEFHNDTAVWNLAFNLCPDSLLVYEHMFGLWDSKNQTMRIYSYIEQLPNSNARYCFYYVSTSSPCFLEADAKAFMPSDSVLRNKANWNIGAIADAYEQPSFKHNTVMPIQKNIDEGLNMPINSGWVCFEVNFSSGKFDLPENGTISFTLYGVEQIDFTGTESLDLAFRCDTCLGSADIVTPGNKHKKAVADTNGTGEFFTGLASAVAQGVSTGKSLDDLGAKDWVSTVAGIGTGILSGVGAICSASGTWRDGNEEGAGSSKLKNLKLTMAFHGTESGTINGQLKSIVGTQTGDVTLGYHYFLKGILDHVGLNPAPKKQKTDSTDSLSLGVWNLKNQPVIYVCGDILKARTPNTGSLISFLDPSSIVPVFNKDNILFDYDEIDSIRIVANDFAFVDGNYTFSTQPYYDYYGIPRDIINPSARILLGLSDADFLLNDQASYQTFTKDGISYTGVAPDGFSDAGMSVYKMVYSPQISSENAPQTLNYLGVSVFLEITFKDGQKRFYAERFLPQIKTFSLAEAPSLLERFLDMEKPNAIDGFPMEVPLFDMQKGKAIRLLCGVVHPIKEVDQFEEENDFYGIRIRSWQDAENPGMVIRLTPYDPGVRYSCSTISDIYDYIDRYRYYVDRKGFYNAFDNLCQNTFGITITDLDIVTKEGDFRHGYCYNTPGYYYISIYHEDAGGNLTLVSE